MGACGRAGKWQVAVGLLRQMRPHGVPPDAHALNAALGACARSGKMDEAILLLKEMQRGAPAGGGGGGAGGGLRADAVTYTTLIDGFTRAGQPHKALRVFDAMPRIRVAPDAVCFQSAIAACGRAGLWRQ
eukprot:1614624-Prymnesium_polylepis.1